jgi:hypothetical protein
MANLKKPIAESAPAPTASASAPSVAAAGTSAPAPKPTVKKPVKKTAPKASEKKPVKKTAAKKPVAAKKTVASAAGKTAGKTVSKKAALPKVRFEDVFALAKSRAKASKANAGKVGKKIAATFQILEGEKEQDFYILIDGGKITLQKYRYDSATIWIKGTAEGLGAVLDNKVKFSDAVSKGTVQIFGTSDPESAKDVVLFVAAIF